MLTIFVNYNVSSNSHTRISISFPNVLGAQRELNVVTIYAATLCEPVRYSTSSKNTAETIFMDSFSVVKFAEHLLRILLIYPKIRIRKQKYI